MLRNCWLNEKLVSSGDENAYHVYIMGAYVQNIYIHTYMAARRGAYLYNDDKLHVCTIRCIDEHDQAVKIQ